MTTNSMTTATPGTAIGKAQKVYFEEVAASLANVNLKLDAEQTACIYAALSSMVAKAKEDKIDIRDIDQSNLKSILENIALLRINLTATPPQGYLIIRKPGKNDVSGKKPVFEFSIMSDGHDALARKFGVGIKKIHPFWAVREGDAFTYPAFSGINITPPSWSPKGYTGKVLRVVYPVEFEDGNVVYYIAEREGVAINLQAHILNNARWEKDAAKKERIQQAITDKPLEAMLNDPTLAEYISPAWKGVHSRESMIQRKMRINALRPIPLDFGNAYTQEAYSDTVNEYRRQEEPDPETIIDTDFETKAGKEPPQLTATSSMLSATQTITQPTAEEIPAASTTPAETPRKLPF